MRKKTFNYLDQDYEIRWTYDGHTIHVRAFKDGKPANGFDYSVSLEVTIDISTTQGQNAVDMLIEYAERDITEGRWESLLTTINESRKQ
jgi:hypothetical protein